MSLAIFRDRDYEICKYDITHTASRATTFQLECRRTNNNKVTAYNNALTKYYITKNER